MPDHISYMDNTLYHKLYTNALKLFLTIFYNYIFYFFKNNFIHPANNIDVPKQLVGSPQNINCAKHRKEVIMSKNSSYLNNTSSNNNSSNSTSNNSQNKSQNSSTDKSQNKSSNKSSNANNCGRSSNSSSNETSKSSNSTNTSSQGR